MELRNKKVLVTGAQGFVGAAVMARLSALGLPPGNIVSPTQAEGDLRTEEGCARAVRGANVVIHLAGVTGGVTFHREHPGKLFYDNCIMGVRLLEAARKAGVEKFVIAGSMAEYPREAPMPLKEETLWDGYPDSVHAPYAIAKTMLLVQAQAYRSEYGFKTAHLLLTSMYGPGEKGDFVIPSLIKRIVAAKQEKAPSVVVWGTGRATRDFLYVEDAAEAIVRAAEKYESPEPLNVGSGKETQIKELALSIAKALGYDGEVTFDAMKPDGAPRRVADIEKARTLLGFDPRIDLETGLKATIAWHTANNQ